VRGIEESRRLGGDAGDEGWRERVAGWEGGGGRGGKKGNVKGCRGMRGGRHGTCQTNLKIEGSSKKIHRLTTVVKQPGPLPSGEKNQLENCFTGKARGEWGGILERDWGATERVKP